MEQEGLKKCGGGGVSVHEVEEAKAGITAARIQEMEVQLQGCCGFDEECAEGPPASPREWLGHRKGGKSGRRGAKTASPSPQETPPKTRKTARAEQLRAEQQEETAAVACLPKKSLRARLLFVEEEATVQLPAAAAATAVTTPAAEREKKKETRAGSRTRRMSERGKRAAAARWNK